MFTTSRRSSVEPNQQQQQYHQEKKTSSSTSGPFEAPYDQLKPLPGSGYWAIFPIILGVGTCLLTYGVYDFFRSISFLFE